MASNKQMIKFLIHERLSKAAEEIFVLFEQSVVEYQTEINRLKNASEPKRIQVVLGPDLSSAGAQQTLTVGEDDEENEISHCKEEAEQLMITGEDQMQITNVQTLVNRDEEQRHSHQQKENSEGAGEQESGGAETDNNFEPTSESEEEEDADTGSDEHPFESDDETKKSFRCPVCKKRFHQERGVKTHMRWAHTKEQPLTSAQLDSERLSLQPDMESFKDRLFSCTVCKRRFKCKLSLAEHMRKHTGGNPYSCTVCFASFPDHVDFICHMKTAHSIETPFKCSVCHKGLKNARNYRSHMLIHTGEKPFLCSVCGRRFLQTGNLRYHMLTHTGEKPFSCSECGAKYTSKQNLMNHKKANH